MSFRFFIAIFLFFGISVWHLTAQNTESENALDKLYTPPANSILGPDYTSSETENTEDDALSRYTFSYNISKLMRNLLSFSVGVQPFDNFDILFRFEKSIGKDKWQILFLANDFPPFESNNGSVIYCNDILTTNSHVSLSTNALGGTLRYYIYENFFEMGIDHYTTKYHATSHETSGGYIFSGVGTLTQNHYFFNFGWHWETNGRNIKFFHELYFGSGLRTFKFNTYDYLYMGHIPYAVKTNEQSMIAVFTGQLGYIIGIGK